MDFKDSWGVKANVVLRVKATFSALPEIPEIAIADGAVNEYLAAAVITEQGNNPTTERVREMVGGKTSIVNARLSKIRHLIKGKRKGGDDLLEGLRKEIRIEEQRKAGAETISIENKYIEEMEELEAKHAAETQALRDQLAQSKGELITTQQHLIEANITTQKFQDLYVEARVERSQLLNLNNEVSSLKEQLAEKKAELLNLDKAQLKQTQANEIQLTKQKEVINLGQKNLANCLDQLAAANDSIAKYKSEVNDLKHEAKQKSLELKEQQVMENIAGQVSEALTPVSDLSNVIDKAKALSDKKRKDDKHIIIAINSLETSMLNLGELTKGIKHSMQKIQEDKSKPRNSK